MTIIDYKHMPDKVIIRLNASSLPYTKCALHWHRVVIQGYKDKIGNPRMIYGVGGHKYIDTMFKTGGDIRQARDAALAAFRMPKHEDRKCKWINDETHFIATCYMYWENYVSKDTSFELVIWPDGKPATEVSFSIKYYEDEWVIVYLEGTMDKLGKFKQGIFAIGDYKFTTSYDNEYLADYEISPQLLFYLMSLEVAAEIEPQSIIGQIGLKRPGAFIEGIFLKSKPTDNEYKRSDVFQYKRETMQFFRSGIDLVIQRLSGLIRNDDWNRREGIINGACREQFKKCPFWFTCRVQDEELATMLLNRDFKVVLPYDPLHHQD